MKIHGATVHFVVPELDAGPIIAQAAIPVLEDDTPDSLAARVLAQEHVIYPRALDHVASGRVRLEGSRTVSETATSALLSLAVPDGTVLLPLAGEGTGAVPAGTVLLPQAGEGVDATSATDEGRPHPFRIGRVSPHPTRLRRTTFSREREKARERCLLGLSFSRLREKVSTQRGDG